MRGGQYGAPSGIEWSPQQERALEAIFEWLTGSEEPTFYLAGYAGTGKSTIAKTIGDMERRRKGYAQFAALTGKAALVLKKKGCMNARTIHSLIYSSHDKSRDELERLQASLATASKPDVADLQAAIEKEAAALKRPAWSLKDKDRCLDIWAEDDWGHPYKQARITLFVIDECSMVDTRLGEDLLSFGVKVLVLGDPAQLPPVAGGGYFTERQPDVLLTEIHRQAVGNPIIDMANQVRLGNDLSLGQYGGGCAVVRPSELTQEDWLNADQILVGRNKTRTAFNARLRTLRGFSGFLPMPGERLVCLRNNHDIGLLNGGLWTVVRVEDDPKGECFNLEAKSVDDDRTVMCQVLKCHFMGTEVPAFIDRKVENEFTFGYALTCHKAQGSQWDNVIYYDEWNWKGHKEHIYTGITRAAERVTVVRP